MYGMNKDGCSGGTGLNHRHWYYIVCREESGSICMLPSFRDNQLMFSLWMETFPLTLLLVPFLTELLHIGSVVAIRELRLIFLHSLWKSPRIRTSAKCVNSQPYLDRINYTCICSPVPIYHASNFYSHTSKNPFLLFFFLPLPKYPVKITRDETRPVQTDVPEVVGKLLPSQSIWWSAICSHRTWKCRNIQFTPNWDQTHRLCFSSSFTAVPLCYCSCTATSSR